ncbi:MAG: MFS transporter [Aggregatilineales bacterium]
MQPERINLQRATIQVVLVSAFLAFVTFGIRLSFSVFFAEFVTVEGWSNEEAATIFSVSMLVFAVGSPIAGALLDRFGARIIFTGGAILMAIGLFLSSQAQTIDQLLLTYGIIAGSGVAVVGLGPIAANISAWIPPAQRGRAIGIAFAGTGLGSLLFVPASNWLITNFGWRDAYLVLAGVCLLILAPMLAIFLRKAPQETRKVKTDSRGGNLLELFKNPIFLLLMLVSLTALGPLRSLTVHQIAYIESIGIERDTAAAYVGLAGFLTAGTFIGWGYISDKFGRWVAFTAGALCLIGAVGVLFVLAETLIVELLILYSILYALAEGTRSSQTTALASDIFQRNGLGLVNGLVGGAFGAGAAFAPWLVGRLKDTTGSYQPGFIVVIVLVVISIGAFLAITGLQRRKRTGD